MSNDLEWLLLRSSNSFMVKGLPEGPIFSREPGNLTNIHSHKYSGLANSKVIDISDNNGNIQITTRKAKASPHAVKSAKAITHVRPRSGPRRALGVAATSTAGRGYRPDLRKTKRFIKGPIKPWWITRHVAIGSRATLDAAALARTSALLAAQKEPKAAPSKKVRGKKAKAFGLA
ncbi:hypothetical protein D9758_014995 [Tetrapyrgos nigripes]|uniref:Ribosomal eL28/Mak16 domain-containing protein n=1 Tax=Tetrapyrgos nigripes TaxID=182062 RepID=A0A8H5FK56_9AGAR|nr:hypothetical protein D9758_018501 [Tetrapyrgos nigripes]KAF5340165.1 hypothetical protein D9758_014995 [Tetrapyrgos nigripes]